jgi:hypothetical protein
MNATHTRRQVILDTGPPGSGPLSPPCKGTRSGAKNPRRNRGHSIKALFCAQRLAANPDLAGNARRLQ